MSISMEIRRLPAGSLRISPWSLVHVDEESRSAAIEWKLFATGENFKYGMMELLKLLKTKRMKQSLWNMPCFPVFLKEDQRWVLNEWLPQAIQSGLQRIAIVSPNGPVFRESIRGVFDDKHKASGVEHRLFPELQQAVRWLINHQ